MHSNDRTAGDRSRAAYRGSHAATIRLISRAAIAAVVVAAVAAVAAGIPWLVVITPRWLVRGAAIAMLWAILVFFVAAVPAAVVAGVWAWMGLARAWRRRDLAAMRGRLRWATLATSGLASLTAMELIAGVVLWQSYRIPHLPTWFPPMALRSSRKSAVRVGPTRRAIARTDSSPADDPGLYIVVVGESSAVGVPYQPRVSIGQVVGWQLANVFPDRAITVDLRARGGLTLEQAMSSLRGLDRRPDAIIVFSGHNELLTHFGWSRAVRHYVDEGPESPLAWLALARHASSTTHLILDALDRLYGEAPPPPHVARELIDHPICTSEEYAATREGFRRELEALTADCEQIGTLAILVVPGSNDGAFAPNRSVLAGETPPAARAAFETAFHSARSLERSDPAAATATFRRLVDRHPEFAEGHYRLARLLAGSGAWGEARAHFIAARDLDAAAIRCPSDFREALKDVAGRHGALLIDCETLFAPLTPHGVLDDHIYHDAHHPNLAGIVVLAQDILEQLHRRRAWGWPESTPVPRIDLAECARHFGIDLAVLATLCERCRKWYRDAAAMCHEPEEREEVAEHYDESGRAIADGRPLPPESPPSLEMVHSIMADSNAPAQ